MKWAIAFSFACMSTFIFAGQTEAQSRMRRPPRSPEASQNEPGGCSNGGSTNPDGTNSSGRENPEPGQNTGSNPIGQIVRNLFQRFDGDRSHTISLQEAPRWMKDRFTQIDTNRDGQIEPKEMMEMIMRYRGEERPNTPPPAEQTRIISNAIPPRY